MLAKYTRVRATMLAVAAGAGLSGVAQAQCGEIVLRDSIGGSPTDAFLGTDGNHAINSTGGSSWSFLTAEIASAVDLRLSMVDMVVAQTGPNLNWAAFDFEVRVWSGHDAVLVSPMNGNVAPDVYFGLDGATSRIPWGQALNDAPAIVPAWRLSFDVGASGIILTGGGTYSIAVQMRRNGDGTDGAPGPVESRESGQSDRRYSASFAPPGWRWFSDSIFSNHSGRVGYRITAVPLSCCGTSDFNGDGDFGTDADIEAFFACLGGACCPTCFEGGSDFNRDGDAGTDADIEAFFRVLGGSAC